MLNYQRVYQVAKLRTFQGYQTDYNASGYPEKFSESCVSQAWQRIHMEGLPLIKHGNGKYGKYRNTSKYHEIPH